MADLDRIVLRIDESVDFERRLYAAYQSRSRSRRQEWFRSIVRAGFELVEGGMPAAPAAELPARGVPADQPVSVAQPQRATSEHGAQLVDSPDASQLKGFFGDE